MNVDVRLITLAVDKMLILMGIGEASGGVLHLVPHQPNVTDKLCCRSPHNSNCIAAVQKNGHLERCNCHWPVFLQRARELPAVTAHLQIHASTPGLGLHGKLAEDHGVNLGVDVAGAKFLFGADHHKFIRRQCTAQSTFYA